MGANCSDFFLERMQYWCVACLKAKLSFLEQSSELPGEFNSSAAKLRRVSQQLILALKILNIIPQKGKNCRIFLISCSVAKKFCCELHSVTNLEFLSKKLFYTFWQKILNVEFRIFGNYLWSNLELKSRFLARKFNYLILIRVK